MRKLRKLSAILISMLLILAVVSGCASKTAREDGMVQYTTAGATKGYSTDSDVGGYGIIAYDSAPAEKRVVETYAENSGSAASGYTVNVDLNRSLDILAQRKLIRNANISIEVGDFYKEYGNIQSMINGIGFVQEITTSRQYYDYKGERRSRIIGNITLRVDAKQFDAILNGIKGLGEITDDRIYSTDITDQFYDTEGRLKILRIEYEFLEEYMMSLKDPDSIFKTRMRMTELQTEIERLTGTLNKWTDLVELSTIYIQMTEKYPEDMKGRTSYWERLGDTIKNSLTGIVDALGDLLIFIIEAIPTLVILAIIGFIGWRIVRRFIRKRHEAHEPVKRDRTGNEPM